MAHRDPPGPSLDPLLDTISDEGLAPKPPPEDALDLAIHLDRAERVPLETWVRLQDGDRTVRALSRDVSETGLHLAATARPVAEPGSQLVVELPLPDHTGPLRLEARVVRSASVHGGVALAFLAPPPEALESLRAYVRRQIQGR